MSNSISMEQYFQIELSHEDGIEFLGVINKKGRIIDFSYKNKISLPITKNEMLFMTTSVIISLQKDFDDDFGPVQFSITYRDNSKFISIPTKFGLIFAIMKKDFDHHILVNKIKNMKTLSESDVLTSDGDLK